MVESNRCPASKSQMLEVDMVETVRQWQNMQLTCGHSPWQADTCHGLGTMMLYIVTTMGIKAELADTDNVQEAIQSSPRALHTPRAKLITLQVRKTGNPREGVSNLKCD